MAELEMSKTTQNSNGLDSSSGSAMKIKSTNAQGEEIMVVTSTNYETQTFSTKNEWRKRAIANSLLYMRLKTIYLASDDFVEEKDVFILPKNLLKRFVEISDTKAQVAGYIFGKKAAGHEKVKEIRTIVIVPQLGNTHTVQLSMLPDYSPYLQDLELLGWTHTQSQELKYMSAPEVTTHSNIFKGEKDLVSLSVCLNPGSISLAAYTVSEEGYSWGSSNKNLFDAEPQGFDPEFSEHAQLMLSDRVTGNFLVPSNDVWNYAFMSAVFSPSAKYELKLDIPIEFYNELHRSIHFLQFSDMVENEELEPEKEDVFA